VLYYPEKKKCKKLWKLTRKFMEDEDSNFYFFFFYVEIILTFLRDKKSEVSRNRRNNYI